MGKKSDTAKIFQKVVEIFCLEPVVKCTPVTHE